MDTKQALQIVASVAGRKIIEDTHSGFDTRQQQSALEEVQRFAKYFEEIMKGVGYSMDDAD